MKTVMRLNKQLRVDDLRLGDFLKVGFVEVDEKTGEPMVIPEPQDKPDPAVKKENTALKKANEKLAKEKEELIQKLSEASDYAENADQTIEQLTARVAELEAAAEGAKD